MSIKKRGGLDSDSISFKSILDSTNQLESIRELINKNLDVKFSELENFKKRAIYGF